MLVDVYFSHVDNCWVEMHYEHLRAVDSLFKDTIILYDYILFILVQYLTKISLIQLDITTEQGNIYKSYLTKITVHLVDN